MNIPNWKLTLTLSLYGLAMGLLTISLISSKFEPFCWLVIFVSCAVIIARNGPGNYFLQGFLVSMMNSVWITAAHAAFFDMYIANHPDEAAMMMTKMPVAMQGPAGMLVMGPIFGAGFGIILGLFSFIASKFVKPSTSAHISAN